MYRQVVLSLCLLLIMTASILAVEKSAPKIVPLENPTIKQLRTSSRLSAADTCTALNADSMAWAIESWVVGDELYKAYIDPEQTCVDPYPFTVTEIHFVIGFGGPTPIIYGADIEAVDLSTPGCPAPGEVLYYSPNYTDQVPEGDLYDIWIELDTPLVVNGPFFAGFYIGGGLDSLCNPTLVVDDNPTLCNSYNIWDDSLGFVDLGNNAWYNFPGRLWLYAVGTVGGNPGPGGPQPEPELAIIHPSDGATLMGIDEVWTQESSGSEIIDYVKFEYSNGGPFYEFGRDFDGRSPLRDGINPAETGDGFSQLWDFSSLPEGEYQVIATAVDTLGRIAADTVSVYLEPTPPTATIISPDNNDLFCSPLEFLMHTTDENLSFIEITRKEAATNFSLGLDVVDPALLDDFNSGPVASAIATRVWSDRGFTYLMKSGSQFETTDQLATKLAIEMEVAADSGSYDEKLLLALKSFFTPRGGVLKFDYQRNPDYYDIRTWVEEEERTVILGLSGATGVWVTVDGFSDWQQPDGSFNVVISDPISGTIQTLSMRKYMGYNQLLYNSAWHNVDMMISFYVSTWVATRTTTGADFDGSNGWSFQWTPTGLIENGRYFFRAKGIDVGGLSDANLVILQYACGSILVPGDYNGDGSSNIADLIYLVEFLVHKGPEPLGGVSRADANGDGYVNIADVIYYMNFLFNGTSPPAN